MVLPIGVLFLILYWISTFNYLLFHSLAEFFSALVAVGVFIVAWNSQRFLTTGYLVFLGVAHLYVALIDLVHTLAYQGMGVFSTPGANLATQLWLSARYLQSISILLSFIFLRRQVLRWAVAGVFGVVLALILASIFFWDIFPIAYVDGAGLTPFKIYSEYLISLFFLIALGLLWINRSEFDYGVLRLMSLSLVFSAASELAFTEYIGVTDFANMAGHLLKILAFYFLYRAIVVTGFLKPYRLLFRNLKAREKELRRAHDELERRVEERTEQLNQTNLSLQREIAEHQRTEAELREYRERLEELVHERTQKLEAEIAERRRLEAEARIYSRRLERSNRHLQDFASIASHDLQEPLRKVRAFGERLMDKAAGRLTPEERDYLERMVSASERMQNMINDLLSYSRVTTRGEPFTLVDLNQVVADVLQDLEVRIEQSRGRVETKPLPQIDADPLQMRQLLQNLIGNGLKFHRKDTPPVVSVEAAGPMQDPDLGEIVEIRVVDNGIGFDESKQEELFQPFFRLVSRSEFEGNGMGLAICGKIVERHSGRIWGENRNGTGAAFIVQLPVRQPRPAESAAD